MIFQLNLNEETIKPLKTTSYTELDFKEASIETIIAKNPSLLLNEDILIIGRQIRDWDKTNERCDLLGIDRNGKLVVIEVKRDGNQHRNKNTTIQSIKYASYCSTYNLNDAAEQYLKYKNIETVENAKQEILDFITDKNEDFEIDNYPRIIIIGKEFSQEVTASVLWLREYKIDIKCISIVPYKDNGGNIYINRKTIIPLKETENFMIHRKEKDDNIKSEQDERRRQQFDTFIQKLNEKIYTKIPVLKNIDTGTNHSSYFYYGNNHYHYEIFVFKCKKVIKVGFHFESNIDEQKFNNFVSKLEKTIKSIGFKILKDNKSQKGCEYEVTLPCKFSDLNSEQFEQNVEKVSDKFCKLYDCISNHVDKNLFNK